MTSGPIHIVTDGTVRFPAGTDVGRYPLTIAPASLRHGARSLPITPDTQLDDVRDLFGDPEPIPSLEAPSPRQLAEIYAELQGRSEQILSLHTSSSLTRAYDNARGASQQFLGRANIQVIDSQTISYGLGLMVTAAGQAILRGASFEEVVRVVRGMVPRMYMVFFLDDLLYLEHNRLVSRSQAILGNMLGLIGFLTLEEGKIVPMEKVRSRVRALEKLVEFVSEFAAVEHLGVLRSTEVSDDETAALLERLQQVHPRIPIGIASYGPAVATYVGFRGLGLIVLEAGDGGR
jgi:DegV family protein with EDD domain